MSPTPLAEADQARNVAVADPPTTWNNGVSPGRRPPNNAPGGPPPGPPGRPGTPGPPGPPSGPPNGGAQGSPTGPPNGQVDPKPDPKADPKYQQQRCFKTADETTICVTDSNSHHNTTDVYEQGGVSDRHNDYAHAANHNVAGSIRGQNMSEAVQGGNTDVGRPGPPGVTKFDSHSFKEDGGFRDTHREDPNPRNGNTFAFEDHKEDNARDGKDSRVHSEKPDGERTDAQSHSLNESHSGVDVKDKSGATDTISKDTIGSEYQNMYQKHHAGADNSDAHDSRVTHGGQVSSDHHREEHTDPNLHTMHEESSGKGSWSFNVIGDNALNDLTKDSANWQPKNGDWGQNSGDWAKNLPRDESHIEISATTAQDLEKRDLQIKHSDLQNTEFSRGQTGSYSSEKRRRCKSRGRCRNGKGRSMNVEQAELEARAVGPVASVPYVPSVLFTNSGSHGESVSSGSPDEMVSSAPQASETADAKPAKPWETTGFTVGMVAAGIVVATLLVVFGIHLNGRKMRKTIKKNKEEQARAKEQEAQRDPTASDSE